MNRLSSFASRVFDISDEKFFILSPVKWFLRRLLVFFALFAALLAGSVGIICMVTVPLLLLCAYLYYLFSKTWLAYNYSKFYVFAIPAASAVTAFLIRLLIYVI